MKGFHVAQEGHVLPLFSGDATGGHTTVPFSMKYAAHVSIIIAFGAIAAVATSITVHQSTDLAGDNAMAIPFNLFAAETASANALGILDTFGPRIAVPATGYVPTAEFQHSFYVIEIDAAELSLDLGLPTTDLNYAYLTVTIGAAASATPVAITAICSGLRSAGELQQTFLQ